MNVLGRAASRCLLCLSACFLPTVPARSHSTPPPPVAKAERDGSHDFDFNLGTWKTRISRLQHPLSGSSSWTKLEGTVVIRKIWGGKAQIEEIEADGPAGPFEGLTLFLYNPRSRQWSLNFANSSDSQMDQPSIGSFRNGRGEFYDQELFRGRAIQVRQTWSDITPDSHRFEQAFSEDGGKTWEANFIALLTREADTGRASAALSPGKEEPGQHDFDFAFGTWREHASRLVHPLSGSHVWIQMDGVSVVDKVWGGRANLTELRTKGPSGPLELIALRLFNPRTHQWSLTFATSKVGVLSSPAAVGEFKQGRGDFYDQELINGKAIWVRFSIFPRSPDTAQSEQAFSEDGGKTWETNWINTYSRVKNPSEGAR